MKKKAQMDTDMIKNLIFIALGLIVLMGFIYYAFANIERESERTACHDAIYTMEWTAKKFPAGGHYVKEFPSACNPNHIRVEETDKEDIKARILMLMGQCFWKYGEGRFYPFDKDFVRDDVIGNVGDILGEHNVIQFWGGNTCAVCSTFELENFDGSISPKEMFEYIEAKNTKDGRSFAEYFNYYDAAEALEVVDTSNFIPVSLSKDNVYTIIFASNPNNIGISHPMIDKIGRTSDYCFPE